MKHTHRFFSLNFLLACSFIAHAMDTSSDPSIFFEHLNLNKKGSRVVNKVVLFQDKSKKTVNFVHLLKYANDLLHVKEQDLDNDGNLVTTFTHDLSIVLILMAYEQIPGIKDIEVYKTHH